VLELVEGPTLAEKLEAGRLSLTEALAVARQIADALEAAHQQGVVHRDLKPGNIKVRDDGTVKVLDFGLARVVEAVAADAGSPTPSSLPGSPATPDMTIVGMFLGTAAYMSPEQAKGQPADKRSDLWAFGCVLYEMLTGKRAFEGDDIAEVVNAVTRAEPNWQALSTDLPLPIRTLLRRCLVKDRRQRVADIYTARFVLDEFASLEAPASTVSAAVLHRRQTAWRRVSTLAMTVIAAGGAAGGAAWFATRPEQARVSRFAVSETGAAGLSIDAISRDLTILPDGTGIVYKGRGIQDGAPQLFVRALEHLEPTALVGGNPRAPFASPNGQWVGFLDITGQGPELKKIEVAGGEPLSLCLIDGPSSGATWGDDDHVIFATSNPSTGLQRVPSAGGKATILTTPDHARGEGDHLWPQYLPGSEAVLFTITPIAGGIDASQVAVLDLRTGTWRVLVSGGSQAQYTKSGHLVYVVGRTLRAVAFDIRRLEVIGTPTPVLSQLSTLTTGTAEFDLAANGTLVYVPAAAGASRERRLVWVDRQGREELVPGAPARAYVSPRLSPDGAQVAVEIRDQENDIWSWNFVRETLTRLTFDPNVDGAPVWMSDDRIVFQTGGSVGGAGFGTLFWRAADGSGGVERLSARMPFPSMLPSSVSPDGTSIVAWTVGFGSAANSGPTFVGSTNDLMMITIKDRRVHPLVQTRFTERNAEISPDGRWLAYESNASGQFQVYVRQFRDVGGAPWQVSTDGGGKPVWARNSAELFYLAPDGSLRTVAVGPGATWAAGKPRKLLDTQPFFTGTDTYHARAYDVAEDGRFLMIKEGASESSAATASIIVVQNWTEELKRLVPTK